jgi:CRISPR/Cas system-associated exonuclease Cas4 (RecB family)
MSGETKDRPQTQIRSDTERTHATRVDDLIDAVSGDTFQTWHDERTYARNIREGTPYFNQPASVKPPRQHSPSSLLQCHRKTAYNQLNAPEESADPEGIFWVGSQFETDIAVPFLQDAVVGDNEYITNSIWVDFTVETDQGELSIRGETDPVIVDADAEPLVLTEIKTKRSIGSVDAPSEHHKAQAHAYLKGLSSKYDGTLTDAIILYGSRTTLDIRAFHVEFDPAFWRDVVVDWAAEHTEYRLTDTLPPASPEQSWECEFCEFSERCGKGQTEYRDIPAHGFLPGVTAYPSEKVTGYLEAIDDAQLTPALAHEYPQLAAEYEVCPWQCSSCDSTFAWDEIDDDSETPACPVCADAGVLTELSINNPVTSRSFKTEQTQLVGHGE